MIIKDSYTIECLKPYLAIDPRVDLAAPYEIDLAGLTQTAAGETAAIADAIAGCLKIGVEHSADTDPEIAHALAETIIAIGQARADDRLVGLGMMAQGDILTHTGRLLEAWDRLEAAGSTFLRAGDTFGWARTRINRLYICPELGNGRAADIERAFAEAAEAERVFEHADRPDRLMRLYHAWAYASLLMGRPELAIAYYQKAVAAAELQRDGHNTDILIAGLYTDLGDAYTAVGELRTAVDYLSRARQVFLDAGNTGAAAIASRSLAVNYTTRGRFREAIHLLRTSVLPHLSDQRADTATLTLIECYMALNRDDEARALAREIIHMSKADPNRSYVLGISALMLSAVEARLGQLDAALEVLALAEPSLQMFEGMATQIQLRRGQLALQQGAYETARAIAATTADSFRRWHQPMHWIEAMLLGGEAALLLGDTASAERAGMEALRAARRAELEPTVYRAFTMLAQVFEAQGRGHSAVRACQAALAVLERIHRALTLSLRPDFMQDKLLPFRLLMRRFLTAGQANRAFETLERLKAQVFLDYLGNRDSLVWVEDEQTRPLLERLARLRDKHHWLSRLRAAPPAQQAQASPWYREAESYTNLLRQTAACETDIRQVTEQLYLHADRGARMPAAAPPLDAVQYHLDDATLLIEFYVDREQVWCIGVTRERAWCHLARCSPDDLRRLVEDKWHSMIDFALSIGPDDPRIGMLAEKARRIGEKLYEYLLRPLEDAVRSKRRVTIVPFGLLHQVPFNALRAAGRYLIETHEVVILPAAALLLRPPVRRDAGATVVAHSWDGQLAISEAEGHAVHALMGGAIHLESAAQLELLRQPPRQVLHISTHGEHRIDQPDFSFIELADGRVYTDDLLQCDLSYELVVLSACEVGRSHVTSGEEMIGLGRGFLYAGAGALITSLWRVDETYTFRLMHALYHALARGESKARALQAAQCALLEKDPALHPAFWAAFQLICNPDPLYAA